MDGWHRAICPDCRPRDHSPECADNWRSARVPWSSKAEAFARRHNREEHGGEDVAEVVTAEK